MTPLHVSQLSANLKVSVADLALSPRTLIVGPNGSGKSAIIDAVRFATTATVADVNGRGVVADDGILGTLTANGAKELFARATFSDGRQTQSTLMKGKRKSGPSLPLAHWPLDNVRENLTGNPDTVRRFLLGLIANEITEERVRGKLGEKYEEYERSVGSATDSKDSPLARLEVAIEYFGKRSRDLNKEANAVDKHGREQANGLGPEPTEKQIEMAKVAYEEALTERGRREGEARAKEQERRRAQFAAGDREKKRAGIQDWIVARERRMNEEYANYERLRIQLAEREAKFAKLSALSTESALLPLKLKRLEALGTVADWYSYVRFDDCLVCGRSLTEASFAQIKDIGSAVKEAADDARAKNSELTAREKEKTEIAALREAVELRRCCALKELEGYEASVAELEALDAAAGEEKGSEEDSASQQPTPLPDIAALSDKLSSLRRNAERHAEVRRAYTSAGSKRAEAERLAALLAICTAAVKKLLIESISEFESRVQCWLPKDDRFGVQLLDGAREVARVGLWKGSDGEGWRLDTALSGGEWARVIAAIASVAGSGAELSIVAMDDRSMGPRRLRAICDGLVIKKETRTKSDPALQIFIATTTAPAGVAVDAEGWIDVEGLPGWTIIQTDALEV